MNWNSLQEQIFFLQYSMIPPVKHNKGIVWNLTMVYEEINLKILQRLNLQAIKAIIFQFHWQLFDFPFLSIITRNIIE